ncbi:3-phosphoshikimate 1-carboxyvinyltransferase [Candidatus Saganbacteria bacterium]|nr:3-phosphoshikimate 1-carboxyvinyltransferase [Candidatus Saganbacteria bacterium]
MKTLKISRTNKLHGEVYIPGDKSISHRAVMLGAIADGETVIDNFLDSEDCLATLDCFRKLGIESRKSKVENRKLVKIQGKGLHGLSKPDGALNVGNSGTTIRLISGILAGQSFETTITGDASIQKRPMKRIAEPLSRMGAGISGREGRDVREKEGGGGSEIYPPLTISGGKLRPIEYKLPMASAQVKSCVLLAGLYAEGETCVIEPAPSRDHTERMLSYLGVKFAKLGNTVSVCGPASFEGRTIDVPGDISSAAFLMVAGLLVPNSDLLLRNVGTNPTRTGILEVLHRMGAQVEVLDEEIISGEPRASIEIRKLKIENRKLEGMEIGGELIPKVIDEIPIIAVLATQATGQTIIKDAKELRVKESDRIKTISTELKKMGAKIKEKEDGMVISGPTKLKGTKVQSYGDHRVAMSLAVAGLIAEGETIIEDTDCIETSFPGFEDLLKKLLD